MSVNPVELCIRWQSQQYYQLPRPTYGGVDTVYPVIFETAVEELRLSPSQTKLFVGEAHRNALNPPLVHWIVGTPESFNACDRFSSGSA